MSSRIVVIALCFLLLSLPALGTNLYPVTDEALSAASARLRAGDAAGALAAARQAAPGGMKDFFIGMTAFRMEKWNEAVDALASAETKFPLLADYAIYHRAVALQKIGKTDEAVAAVRRLLKEHPETPFLRQAELLEPDLLSAKGDHAAALAGYLKFVEKYASGNDAITALYKSGTCRGLLGDASGAAKTFRNVWLNNPGSPFAAQADDQLKKLASEGVRVEPFSADELTRRATTLFDLRNYSAAAESLDAVPRTGLSEDAIARLTVKKGQALFRARRYQEAEQALAAPATAARSELKDDAAYWLARTLDKQGKQDEAVRLYLGIIEQTPPSPRADDALLEAALIRKYQGKEIEAIGLMEKLAREYPRSPHARRAAWEAAWTRYLLKDYKAAADGFAKLKDMEDYREKALYWHGRAADLAGDKEGAAASFTLLLKEYPLGFYALNYKKDKGIAEAFPALPDNLASLFVVPHGFDRAKALITLGMTDEAAKELASAKKKNGKKQKDVTAGIARLYLEVGNFNALSALYRGEKPARTDREGMQAWGANYPLAFRGHVEESARASKVSRSLVYSVMKAESSFHPGAKSPVGAVGLMQLMPATARQMEADKGKEAALIDPKTNIRLGTRHLRDVLALYRGNAALAAAAYNAGAANVARWRKNFGHLPEMEFIENIPYPETREYVKKVVAGAEIYSRLYSLKEDSSRTFRGYSSESEAVSYLR